MVLIDFEMMQNDSDEPGNVYADCFTWAIPVIHKLINKNVDCDYIKLNSRELEAFDYAICPCGDYYIDDADFEKFIYYVNELNRIAEEFNDTCDYLNEQYKLFRSDDYVGILKYKF